MAQGSLGPCYYISGLFLWLGTAALCFGFSSGLWDVVDVLGVKAVYSIWLSCEYDSPTQCDIFDFTDADVEWIAQMTVVCAGVFFAVLALLSWMCMCCCCTESRACMIGQTFMLMAISGASGAAAVIMFALIGGEQRWETWDDFTSDPEHKYGYFVYSGGAALMLLGSMFCLCGCCCREDKNEFV